MKNLKALTLTALTAFGIAAAPAAKAQVKEIVPQQFTHPAVQRVAHLLNRAGVPIIDAGNHKRCQPDGRGGVLYGFYNPKANGMVLCTANGDNAKIIETFLHEAVHVIQDCRMGLKNESTATGYGAKQMANRLPAEEVRWVRSHYPHDQHNHEFEARFLDNSPEAIAKGLTTYCF